jgi:hypothetical protein
MDHRPDPPHGPVEPTPPDEQSKGTGVPADPQPPSETVTEVPEDEDIDASQDDSDEESVPPLDLGLARQPSGNSESVPHDEDVHPNRQDSAAAEPSRASVPP